MSDNADMSGSASPLHLNDPLQLQAVQDEHAPRFNVRLIGMQPGASIMVSTPVVDGRVQIIREGQVFIARAFSRGRVWAFTCRVLRSCVQPFSYLHLSYPDELQHIVVRKSRRINVSLSGTVGNLATGQTLPCSVVDLSITGAQIECREPMAKVGEPIALALALPIAEIGDRNVRVEAVVRSVAGEREVLNRIRYGAEFRKLDVPAQLMLRAFMYDQLYDDQT